MRKPAIGRKRDRLAPSRIDTVDVEHAGDPVRPRELLLNGRDPCALIPRSDWTKFYIEGPGNPKQQETFKSPACLYSNRAGAFVIVLVVTEGIDAWRSGDRAAKPQETEPIKGYPAISLHRPEDKTGCDVVVDVADGQYLLATVVIRPDKLSALPSAATTRISGRNRR